jgi:hypothetical protein
LCWKTEKEKRTGREKRKESRKLRPWIVRQSERGSKKASFLIIKAFEEKKLSMIADKLKK